MKEAIDAVGRLQFSDFAEGEAEAPCPEQSGVDQGQEAHGAVGLGSDFGCDGGLMLAGDHLDCSILGCRVGMIVLAVVKLGVTSAFVNHATLWHHPLPVLTACGG